MNLCIYIDAPSVSKTTNTDYLVIRCTHEARDVFPLTSGCYQYPAREYSK